MSLEIGTPVRYEGSVRNPDREGALAHLDLDRGFALVARASVTVADVIDPTIWVREKLTMAMAGAVGEPPLRAALAAVRSLHGEIMKRPERDRSWIAVHLLLFQGDDGVAISAGDCPCYRYRNGVLAGLGKPRDDAASEVPRGSLGSETQVRIEVVPLRPQPGDLYLLATRPLHEGEVVLLARALEEARTPVQLVRAGVEGRSDSGRLAIRILAPGEVARDPRTEEEPVSAAAEPPAEVISAEAISEPTAELQPQIPDAAMESSYDHAETEFDSGPGADDQSADLLTYSDLGPEVSSREAPAAPPVDALELEVPASEPAGDVATESPEADRGPEPATEPHDHDLDFQREPPAPAEPEGIDSGGEAAPEPPRAPRRPALAAVGDERPWYEPLAIWGGGALAIIALALLVRAILPGILGTDSERPAPTRSAPPGVARSAGGLDIVSEPPGASVKLDGETLPGRTPLAGVVVDPGVHHVELDWGAGGSWRDTIEVAAGAKLTLHPAIYGSIAFRASEADRVLDVYVDGAYAGTTPVTLDRVTVGRHLVRFGGPGLSMTAQEVDVLHGVHVELVGNAGAPPAPGALTIKSAVLGDEGFQAGRGDPVWVDGIARGATPFSIDLPPGMHSVRVVRRDFPAQVSVIEVKPGGEHFVTAEFGARSEEPLRFEPPASLSRSQPTPLTVTLPERASDTPQALWLHVAAPGGSFQARSMSPVAEGSNDYAALVPDEVMRNAANQIRVYFRAAGPDGHEIYTEIKTIPIRD